LQGVRYKSPQNYNAYFSEAIETINIETANPPINYVPQWSVAVDELPYTFGYSNQLDRLHVLYANPTGPMKYRIQTLNYD
jgi:hypothetical protein